MTVNDQAENDWVFQTFGGFGSVARALWIGLNDSQTERSFVWASSENSLFTFWGFAQPDNGGPGAFREHFVHIWPPGPLPPNQTHDGFWNDFQDIDTVEGHPLNGVVEVTPPCQPLLSIRVSQVEICWDTCTNAAYQLQYRSDLTTNVWLPFSSNFARGTGGIICSNDTVLMGQPQRFYRVIVTNQLPQL